ncbi:zinc-binding protein A33-like [Clupea harengus]|uniref:Zinc-binding protein A33-like n=1 Tax=Clupea harengus TaxID=7950 RepID=A0A8M1KHX2_CLUHA|nr:zinc-binding protein A33-like [Clupea harengus]
MEKDVKQYAVDVTLDPETAYPSLILSADGKQVKYISTRSDLPSNPKRFDTSISVLGKQGFSSGRFYYEVQVKGKTGWYLGVTRESSNRKGSIDENPENGYWTIRQINWKTFRALDDSSVPLKPLNELERVGVFVDYEAGLVSFYNADHWDLLYSFKHAHFNGTIYPVFNPNNHNGGPNSSPLIIHTPVACQYHHNK